MPSNAKECEGMQRNAKGMLKNAKEHYDTCFLFKAAFGGNKQKTIYAITRERLTT